MQYRIENPKIVSSFKNKSKAFGKVNNRLTHGFIIKIKGYNEYDFGDKRIKINEGELIFLPKGSSYEYVSNTEGENLYTSINFEADIDNKEVTVYSLKDFYGLDFLSESFSVLWKFGNTAERYECMSVFYSLLAFLSRTDTTNDKNLKKFEIIEPAVSYLISHVYDSELKVDRLHRLCGISDTYFRKLFRLKMSMTPVEYLTNIRLSHARSIIESGDFDCIKEVALSVGYTDPLYFSKAFKARYGISPSLINR